MRKLLLSILALVLLATTALAAPDGWRRLNGMWVNEGVEQQADAIERGGSFYLDLDAKALALYPWRDGSTDVLYMQPVGLEYDGPMVETPYGWKIPLKNHVYGATFLQLVDLQSARVPDALADYLGNGVALIYSGMPVANIPQGEWIPKRVAFSGMVDDCTFTVYGDWGTEFYDGQFPWLEGSLEIVHKTKRHNAGHRNYMSGMLAGLPRPVAIGRRNGEITGWAYGKWVQVGPYKFDKVFFRDAQFDADMTRRNIGNPQTISVSADLGYTSIGSAQLLANGQESVLFTIGTMPSDAVVTDHVVYIDSASGAAAYFTALYEDGGTYPTTPVGGDLTTNSQTTQKAVSNATWETFTPITTTHDVASGTGLWLLINAYNDPVSNIGLRRNVLAGHFAGQDKSGPQITVAEDPYAGGNFEGPWDSYQMSGYVTYDLATTPPTVSTVIASPSEVTAGTNITLIAGITDDDHTISEAEYYIGADPGEGNGVAMSLGAGTTSRTATATIDTTALLGPYTVRVRGKDETDGWGATNFDTFTVNAAPAGATGGAGISTSIGLEL